MEYHVHLFYLYSLARQLLEYMLRGSYWLSTKRIIFHWLLLTYGYDKSYFILLWRVSCSLNSKLRLHQLFVSPLVEDYGQDIVHWLVNRLITNRVYIYSLSPYRGATRGRHRQIYN